MNEKDLTSFKGVLSVEQVQERLRAISKEIHDFLAMQLPPTAERTPEVLSALRENCLRLAQSMMDQLRRELWPPDGLVPTNVIFDLDEDEDEAELEVMLIVPPDIAYCLGVLRAVVASENDGVTIVADKEQADGNSDEGK